MLTNYIKNLIWGSEKDFFKVKLGLAKGLKFYLDPKTQAQIIMGLEEIELAKYFRKYISRVLTFIDVGAASGFYSLSCASLNEQIKVLAFDGFDEMHRLFKMNQSRNLLKDPDRIKLSLSMVGTTMKRLDEILSESAEPILCKIDVEGNELDVIESGRKGLKDKDCALIVETHSAELEKECDELLKDIGFKTKIVKNAFWRAIIPEGRTIQQNRWIIAEKL